MAFKTGATVILEKSFMYPYRIIETMLKEKVTGFPIVPTMSAILLQMEDIKKMSFPALRYISNTAAALPVSHIQKLREFFSGAKMYSMYGLTECKRVSYLVPEEIDRRPGSVGKAMPNTEAYIVNENGTRVGPNVIGELVVSGPHVMRGYWEMPEETALMLRPGANAGEQVLYSIDGVVEAAVIGVPDPILGQAIKAVVVKKERHPLTEKDILSFCAKHLEDHMVPKEIGRASCRGRV